MDTGDHPRVDDTDMLFRTDITVYQMLIGCAQWEITLVVHGVQYETNCLASIFGRVYLVQRYVQGILSVQELEYNLSNYIELYRMFGQFQKYELGILNSI